VVTITPPFTGRQLDEKARDLHIPDNGMGGFPIVGDSDFIASPLRRLAEAGLIGISIPFVDYLDVLQSFQDEVLPRLARLGLRDTM